MKIKYNQNPLRTEVILTEEEERELWYKIKISHLENSINYALMYLNEGSNKFSIEKAKDKLSYIDQYAHEHLDLVIKSLKHMHIGDCVCVPSLCAKCHSEHLLGIDTLYGLGKHEAEHILIAFGVLDDNCEQDKTIDEALEYLSNCIKTDYNSPPTNISDTWEQDEVEEDTEYLKYEVKNAYEWLLEYKQKHGF